MSKVSVMKAHTGILNELLCVVWNCVCVSEPTCSHAQTLSIRPCSKRNGPWKAARPPRRRWTWRACRRLRCSARSSESWPHSQTQPARQRWKHFQTHVSCIWRMTTQRGQRWDNLRLYISQNTRCRGSWSVLQYSVDIHIILNDLDEYLEQPSVNTVPYITFCTVYKLSWNQGCLTKATKIKHKIACAIVSVT